MEAHDLFATKGIEYLLALAYLALLIPFWRFLAARPREGRAAPDARARPSHWFPVPDGYFLHRGHTWARRHGEDQIKVGLDAFASRLLGAPRAVGLPGPGTHLQQGARAFHVQVDGHTFPLLSPASGQVVQVNEALLRTPDLLVQDPYGAGWLLTLRSADPGPTFNNLLTTPLGRAWMVEQTRELARRMGGELGVVLQDGGEPVAGFARSLAPGDWVRHAEDFLLTEAVSQDA